MTIREHFEMYQKNQQAYIINESENFLAIERREDGALALTNINCGPEEAGPCDETEDVEFAKAEWLAVVG